MRIAREKLQKLCHKKSLSLNALLRRAGVSKTAFYHMLYKETVLPRSIHTLAGVLGVKPSAFLEEESPELAKIRHISAMTDRIVAENPTLDRENVRHTLLLLEEDPLQRLRRGLIRARKLDLHR